MTVCLSVPFSISVLFTFPLSCYAVCCPVSVDAEKFPLSRQLANVTNLPTFAYFADGEFKNQVQTNKVDSLKQFIDETSSN